MTIEKKEKKIILCADDFAMNKEISEGILDLLSLERLSAVSCMTSSPFWMEHSQQLHFFRKNILVGLHLNLTQGNLFCERPQSISTLITKSYLGTLNKKLLRKELFSQMEAFLDLFKEPPAFIDGHQHIHHLPYVREVVSEMYHKFMGRGFVRSVASYSTLNFLLFVKTLILNMTGAKASTVFFKKNRVPFNSSFLGVRNFGENDFSYFMKETLKRSKNGVLIMCHPAAKLSPEHMGDNIKEARVSEYNYFKSDEFLEDLKNAGLCLKSV